MNTAHEVNNITSRAHPCRVTVICLVALFSTMILSACANQAGPPTVKEPALRLPVTTVAVQTIEQHVSLPALVTALPDHSVKVSPAIAGKLKAVYVVPGQSVAKGQLIAVLDSTQVRDQVKQAHAKVLGARAAVAQQQTALLLAQNTEERTRKLVALEVGAQKDLVAAQSQVKTAQAQVTAAQAAVQDAVAAEAAATAQLAYTNVHSPIAGIVAQRLLDVGEPTDVNSPIVVIENLSQVVVQASLPTTQPANIVPGQPAFIEAIAYPGRIFGGRVLSVNPMVEQSGTTIGVRILSDNPSYDLKDGMPVTASIVVGTHVNALTVPSTAIVDDPERPNTKMVYVDKNGTIGRVVVRTGLQQAGRVEILSGLFAGERIVASGAYGLPDGTKIASQ